MVLNKKSPSIESRAQDLAKIFSGFAGLSEKETVVLYNLIQLKMSSNVDKFNSEIRKELQNKTNMTEANLNNYLLKLRNKKILEYDSYRNLVFSKIFSQISYNTKSLTINFIE